MRLDKCDERALRPSHLRGNFSSKAGREAPAIDAPT